MSRALCTLAKGARAPRQVNPVTDGEENPLHALHGSKPYPRTGATADFHEAPLHHMGRPQRPPEGPRTLEEGEQLGAIATPPCHAWRIRVPPPARDGLGVVVRLRSARRRIDRLGIRLHRGVVPPPPRGPEELAARVDPAALRPNSGRVRLPRGRQPGTAIGYNPLELAAFQAASIAIGHRPAHPAGLSPVPGAIRPDPGGPYTLDPVASTGAPHS